jgi:hypothetical protein
VIGKQSCKEIGGPRVYRALHKRCAHEEVGELNKIVKAALSLYLVKAGVNV